MLQQRYATPRVLTKLRIRQYKKKIASWGLHQYHKADDLSWIAAKDAKRKRNVIWARGLHQPVSFLEVTFNSITGLNIGLQLHLRESSTLRRMVGQASHQAVRTLPVGAL